MARPKGSKNKIQAQIAEAGNPAFNIKDATPVDQNWMAVPTAEDALLDRELERLAQTESPPVSDPDVPVMKQNSIPYTLLSEFVYDVKPATTLIELEDLVWQAKANKADSVECSEAIFKYFNKNGDPRNVGYFHYKDIMVYKVGFFEQSKKRSNESIEQRIFGQPKAEKNEKTAWLKV